MSISISIAIRLTTSKTTSTSIVYYLCITSVSIEHLDITKMCKLNASFITVCYSG